jgi:hypothetical protein
LLSRLCTIIYTHKAHDFFRLPCVFVAHPALLYLVVASLLIRVPFACFVPIYSPSSSYVPHHPFIRCVQHHSSRFIQHRSGVFNIHLVSSTSIRCIKNPSIYYLQHL